MGAPVCVVVDELSEVAAAQAAAPPKAAAAAPAAKPAAAAAAPPVAAPAPAPVAAPVPAPAPAKPAAAAAAPAPVAAPKAAAAAPAAPAPKAAAPAASAAAGGGEFLPFATWGQSLARAPMGVAVGKLQRDHVSAFGYSGYDAIAAPAEEKKKPAAAK